MSTRAQATPTPTSRRVGARGQHSSASHIVADCAVLIITVSVLFVSQLVFVPRSASGSALFLAIGLNIVVACYSGSVFPEGPLNIRATERMVRGLGIFLTFFLLTSIIYGKHPLMISGAALVTSMAASGRLRRSRGPKVALQLPILQSRIKRIIDWIASSFLLVLLAPLFVALSILVILDSPGPVFFRHERVGMNGTSFLMWKFRSMKPNAPRYQCSPRSDGDPRLTRVGRVLRRYSLDELPQLINVFRGEMSLVGPRPEMPFIVQQYGPKERRRFETKPGITGLWQISAARAHPIHEHLEYDLYYIAEQNFFLDIAIMVRTVTAVFRGIGAA